MYKQVNNKHKTCLLFTMNALIVYQNRRNSSVSSYLPQICNLTQNSKLEKSLAMEKLKKRRADTRRKIEMGGLVIKSGMDGCNKSVMLGALSYALQLTDNDPHYKMLFESIGDSLFLKK